MSKILGLDVSSYIGCAMIDNNEVKTKLIHFKEYQGFKRLLTLEQAISSTLDDWQPDEIIIEGYALGSTNNLQLMVEIGTLVRRQVYLRKLGWWEIAPTSLKMWVTGKGNAKKPDMAKAVKDKWGFENKSDDIVDAYALAKFLEAVKVDPKLENTKGVKYHANK